MRIIACLATLILATTLKGEKIDFTGGTAYFVGGGSAMVNDADQYWDVDHYEESGFRLQFIGDLTVNWTSFVGDYCGWGSEIHGHWVGHAGLTGIKVERIDGGTFDLNYIAITANTDTSSDPSGNERTYIRNNFGHDLLLPEVGWCGHPATLFSLPDTYHGITEFSFYAVGEGFCFGLTELSIDSPSVPGVPDRGSSLILLGFALASLAIHRRLLRESYPRLLEE